jgi:hypothetical protein
MRGIIRFLFGLILIIAIGWVGLWWYAEGRIEDGFTAWADKQAVMGYTVAYTGLHRGTSPLEAGLLIDNLTVTVPDKTTGTNVVVTFPSLGFRIEVFNPLVMYTDVPDKISIDAGGNFDVVQNAGSISASNDLDPAALFNKSVYPFRGGQIVEKNVDILGSSGSLLILHFDQLSVQASLNMQAGASDTALAETLSMDNVALSPLMTRVLSIPFGGKITHLGLTLNVSGPLPANLSALADQIRATAHDPVAEQKVFVPVLHDWATQGGNGNIALTTVIGPSTLTAAAAVKFDANVQPEGTADVTANHLDQFTGAITNAYPDAQDDIAQAEAQLSQYLTTTSDGGQTLTMHIVYGSGAVNVNGQKVGPMPPVDWNTLENPPPASAAPEDDNNGDDSGATAPAAPDQGSKQ